MQQRIRLCAVHELGPGTRQVIEINEVEEVLVLNLDGTIYAISNICPHEGAALERGHVDGTMLFCPLHRWGFALTTGRCIDDASVCARVYTVEAHDDALYVCVP